ncbi:MAG: MoaD/ThiS family protein [Gammaproteobacteria bacterium]|nr:MoaD/ThiS family protein [Gammaproteobacteria bacterium]
MPTIEFTPNLKRHVDCPSLELDAATIGDCLAAYFERYPNVRHYVLDDQGAVRHHVKVLVDGRNIHDRARLSDPLEPNSKIHVFQALSGG